MPGTTTDTVPTMLTPGEFVIKRESAKMLGKPFLEKLNAVSDNSAHSNIDALISQATLAQMKPMMGGGVVNDYMGGGDVSNYMYGGDIESYMYGGGIKKKKKMAGYQEGGGVNDLSPEDLDFMNMSQNVSGIEEYLDPKIVFGEDYKNLSAEELDFRAKGFRNFIDKFRSVRQGDFSEGGYEAGKGKGYDGITQGDANELDFLFYNIRKLKEEQEPGYVNTSGFMPEVKRGTGEAMMRYFQSQFDDKPLRRDFGVDDIGMQRGGAVGDNTATSAMDALIAQAKIAELQKKNPISEYSMVDADRVDAENQALLDMIMSMSIPASGVAGMAKGVTGKLPKLGKKFASMSPDKGKQEILNKIASEMNVAPSRKVMQNPSRNLYDYKDYKVLEKRPESVSVMDLVNPGYLQKFTNRLVRASKNVGDVRMGDVVDADFPSGFMNLNDIAEGFTKIPKKLQKEQSKELLKYFGVDLKNVRGKQAGGEIDSVNNEALQKLLQEEMVRAYFSGDKSSMPQRIEMSPEEDRFRQNPNPENPFGMTILDDLLLRAYDNYKFGSTSPMQP